MIDYSKELQLPVDVFNAQQQIILSTTTEDEYAIHPTDQDSGIHWRSDGVLEIWAGAASIILDANTGSLFLNGNHLVNSTIDTNFITGAQNSFGINYYPLNDAWMNYGITNDPKLHPELQPLTYKSLTDQLVHGALNGANLSFITGAPASDLQKTVKFSDVFTTKPLFLASTYSYLDELDDIVNELLG